MPADDLLRFIGGPPGFSAWWTVLGIALALTVCGWGAGVFVWTMPPSKLRRLPVINRMHARINRRRFARAVRKVAARCRGGDLTPAQAGARISRTIRSFLYVATGVRAQYMHVGQLADGPLAAAAPLLGELNDAQFNPATRVDVAALAHSAEELISSWN